MTPEEQIVDKLFADLRDRRFLKWLFSEEPTIVCRILIGQRKEDLESLDPEIQAEIRHAWQTIIADAIAEAIRQERRTHFIEFAPSMKSAQGRNFWYAEGWIDGKRYEFSTQTDQSEACLLCHRLNVVLQAAIEARED